MSHNKKKTEPEKPSSPVLGWIALLAVVAAIGVFLLTRNRSDNSSAQLPLPAPASTQSQGVPPMPAVPAPSQTETTATQPAQSVPHAPANPHVAHEIPPPSPVNPQAEPEYRMPAYFETPEAAEPLAPTLNPATVQPHAREAYEVAQKKPKLLAQLPCFCYCDRFGHKSLHDCYASNHAEECDICMREALEANKMDEEGMSPREIRSIIVASHHPKS